MDSRTMIAWGFVLLTSLLGLLIFGYQLMRALLRGRILFLSVSDHPLLHEVLSKEYSLWKNPLRFFIAFILTLLPFLLCLASFSYALGYFLGIDDVNLARPFVTFISFGSEQIKLFEFFTNYNAPLIVAILLFILGYHKGDLKHILSPKSLTADIDGLKITVKYRWVDSNVWTSSVELFLGDDSIVKEIYPATGKSHPSISKKISINGQKNYLLEVFLHKTMFSAKIQLKLDGKKIAGDDF